jgi:hypothetical protein
MVCKGCGEDKKLIRAHVIPESFFVGLRDGEKPTKIISSTPGVYPKKSFIGVYDKNILCQECEDQFQDLYDYGCKALIQDESNLEKIHHNGNLVGYRINNINFEKLKLFFISILWRASITTNFFFKDVDLGALENQAKQIIWERHIPSIHDFSFVLSKFDDDGAGRTILDPHRERWFNINYYRFYLYGYILYIKADSGKTPEKFKKFIPEDDSLIVISRGDMRNAKEYPLMLQAASMPQNISKITLKN